MWWKRNKWKVIAPVLVMALLAAAFWHGGGAPGARGWPAEAGDTPAAPAEAEPVPAPESAGEAQPPGEELPREAGAQSLPGGAEDGPNAGEQPEAAGEAPGISTAGGKAPGQDTGKDPYLTDPVPPGRPAPVEPQDAAVTGAAHTCTLSISCAAILDHPEWLDPEKAELVPEDGWVLQPTEVAFHEGESVFDVLQRTCRQQGIHMEYENTPMYNSAYIEGIHNLYEFDCGELSGWMYKVNGWFPNYGCSRYQLREGDEVCWVYTCDLGADVGGAYAAE